MKDFQDSATTGTTTHNGMTFKQDASTSAGTKPPLPMLVTVAGLIASDPAPPAARITINDAVNELATLHEQNAELKTSLAETLADNEMMGRIRNNSLATRSNSVKQK